MKVLAICGSMRADSTSRWAVDRALAGAAAAGAQVGTCHLRELDLPLCDGRSDESTYGGDVDRLRQAVAGADALIIGSPEYHGSMTGALKNAFDLLATDQIAGKMVALVATARGDAGAMNTLNHLRHVCRWMKAWVLPTQVSVPRAQDAFDASGNVTRPELEAELARLGEELVRYSGLMKG